MTHFIFFASETKRVWKNRQWQHENRTLEIATGINEYIKHHISTHSKSCNLSFYPRQHQTECPSDFFDTEYIVIYMLILKMFTREIQNFDTFVFVAKTLHPFHCYHRCVSAKVFPVSALLVATHFHTHTHTRVLFHSSSSFFLVLLNGC